MVSTLVVFCKVLIRIQVVEDFSSKLGHPFETTETIDANHMDMVSIGAREISAVINRYVGDIKKNIRV